MASGWKSQNAWSDRRALWQINEFCSRRTIESVNAARQGRQPRETADIIAEDVIYAICGQKRDDFINVCTRKVVEIHFETLVNDNGHLRIKVQQADDTWYAESHVVTLDQYNFAIVTIAEVEAIRDQRKAARSARPEPVEGQEAQS